MPFFCWWLFVADWRLCFVCVIEINSPEKQSIECCKRFFVALDLQLGFKFLPLQSFKKGINNDSVAQLVEHYTFNVVVLGSNPSGITENSIKKT